MTKKGFEAIAAIVRREKDSQASLQAQVAVRNIVDGLCDHFTATEERFNETIFRVACGFPIKLR